MPALAEELSAAAPELAAGACDATGSLDEVAAGYEHAGRLIAPLFVQLMLAGQGDPCGPLVFSRFAVLQAQIEFNRRELKRLHRRAMAAAGAQWLAAVDMWRMSLNLHDATASPAGRDLQTLLAARRLRIDITQVRERREEGLALGDAAHHLACRALELDPEDRTREFSPELRALAIVLRMLTVQVENEQV